MSQEMMLPIAMAGAGTLIGNMAGGQRGGEIGALAGGGLGAGADLFQGMGGMKGLAGLFGGGTATPGASPLGQPGSMPPTSVMGSIPSTMGGMPPSPGIQTQNIGGTPPMPMAPRPPMGAPTPMAVPPRPSMPPPMASPTPSPQPSPQAQPSPQSQLPSTLPPTQITGGQQSGQQGSSAAGMLPLVARALGLGGGGGINPGWSNGPWSGAKSVFDAITQVPKVTPFGPQMGGGAPPQIGPGGSMIEGPGAISGPAANAALGMDPMTAYLLRLFQSPPPMVE